MLSRLCVCFCSCSLLLPSVSAGDAFPEWRGTGGQGVAEASGLPVSWSEQNNVAWKAEIRGHGWSTPVIAGGRVWVTTATDVPASKADAKRRRDASTNSQPLTISESATFYAVGLDLATGEVLCEQELMTVRDPQMIHADNSYATPTPIIDGDQLYCHFGSCGMVCLNTSTLDVVWTNSRLSVALENGPGSSPILWNDRLIVHCDGIDQQYITAISKDTGEELWKTARSGELNENPQLRKSYATPLMVDVDGQPQVISPAADWLYGYDPVDGRELWKIAYGKLGFSNAARPVAGHGLVYISTGYMQPELLAIRPGTADREPELAWKFTKQVPAVSSPLLYGNELYMVSDKGITSCLDARSGDLVWKERIGARFWASPVMADGRIHFFDRDSTTTVISPGRTFQKLAVNKLSGEQLATAAAVDGSLLIRTAEALYCLRAL